MSISIKAKNETIGLLREYDGLNPFILRMQRDIILLGKMNLYTDFVAEYIKENYKTSPKAINKIVTIADWYGKELKNTYNIEFTPEKVLIMTFLGETSHSYHCYIKYRQNMDPLEIFLSKKGVMENFIVEDYHNYQVDFDRFDMLSTSKDPNRKLKEHQKEAVQFLLHRKKCILADDMGVGKTTELSVASIEGNFDSVLIICPASLKYGWKKELMWYIPEKDITIIESFKDKTKNELEKFLGYGEGKSGKKRQELEEEAIEKGKWQDNRFVIVNFDVLDEFYTIASSRSKANLEKALEESPMLKYITNKKSLLIVDEAHKLSNNTSNRYKIIKNLIRRGKLNSIFLATGTPITNNPQNLYCILQLLDDPITNDWEYFMTRYCGAMKIPAKGEKERWTNNYLNRVHKNSWFELTDDEKSELKSYISQNARKITVAKDGTNLEELKKRIQHIYLRREKEDISEGLPNKTVHEVFYNFNATQYEEYSRLWDEYEKEQLSIDPLKDLNKDLIEGSLYRKYCSNQMIPNTIKMVDSFIANNEKVIIATCFDEELYTLKEYYGDKCVIFNGKSSAKDKIKAEKEFKENDNVKVFIGQILAAGVGLTLTSANKMVFNNIDFVPGNCRQMEDRIYRIGQTKDVDIYYQIFNGTQYQRIWNTVMRKELMINQVIKKESEK